jgi:hypothetical protein
MTVRAGYYHDFVTAACGLAPALLLSLRYPALKTISMGENKMAKAQFVVRASVADASKRAAFDAWYSREHLPDAVKSFGAEKAWRYWSLTDPALHHAIYQFADEAALDRATKTPDMSRLVADFNRDWPEVTRTRELLVLAEEFVK